MGLPGLGICRVLTAVFFSFVKHFKITTKHLWSFLKNLKSKQFKYKGTKTYLQGLDYSRQDIVWQQSRPSLTLCNVQIISPTCPLTVYPLCDWIHLCVSTCMPVCWCFRCRWLPVKVRSLPHFRSIWQCRLKKRKGWGAPLVSFPQWRSCVLPQALCMSSALKLLCISGKKKSQQERVTCPRARTKPKYLCLRKSCSRGDDTLSRTQSTWLPVPSLSVCFWYFCTEGWKQLTYYLIIRKLTDFGKILFLH